MSQQQITESQSDATHPGNPEADGSDIVPSLTMAPLLYQAVGLVQAELHMTEPGSYYLQWNDRAWTVYLRKKILDNAEHLLGKLLYWRVYPHTTHTKQGFIVNRFTVVSQPTTPADPQDGHFKLAGCWESLPRWQSEPIRQSFFSVYRNAATANRPPSKSYNQHYSLNWDEPPFIPGPGHVIPWHSIVAKLQSDGVFEFVRLVDGPKPAPDRLKRPSRKKDNRDRVPLPQPIKK